MGKNSSKKWASLDVKQAIQVKKKKLPRTAQERGWVAEHDSPTWD